MTEGSRKKLANEIKVTVGKEGLIRLDVTAATPSEAQRIANAVVDVWLKSTVPGEQDRSDLEKRLDHAQTALAAVNGFLERLAAQDVVNLNKPLTRGEAGVSIVAVGELQARYLDDVLTIPRVLKGLSRDVVRQPPTLPGDPVGPQKSLIVMLAAFACGFALLLWVLMGHVWRSVAHDPQIAEKQSKLLAAVSFKALSR